MIDTIYIERDILDHPRTRAICARYPRATKIECERYGEVFNRRAQSFRLQKRNPALILASKFDNLVLPAPPAYGIGTGQNYYFSHMLNCPYDCRYCFLQGMFQSAHYVLFVNYEDFREAIREKVEASAGERTYFYSGYDCDSLAMDSVSHFTESFFPIFASMPEAWLELRTKSVQVRPLLERDVIPNVIAAFSFTPEAVSQTLEHKVPPIELRLEAMQKLQARGWKLGLRFDPLIYFEGYRGAYAELFGKVFEAVRADTLHSVSLGPFRVPRAMFKTMERLYPEEPLFAAPMEDQEGMISYKRGMEEEIVEFCTDALAAYIPEDIFYPCPVRVGA